jgi:hypothetical protein
MGKSGEFSHEARSCSLKAALRGWRAVEHPDWHCAPIMAMLKKWN